MSEAEELSFGDFLAALLQEALQGQCALPASFCEGLLRTDPCDHVDCAGRINATSDDAQMIESCCRGDGLLEEGVPVYPLYKQLAATISNYVTTGHFRTTPSFPELVEEHTQTEKIPFWLERVKEHGCALREAFLQCNFRLHVEDKFYKQLKDGSKIVEGQCATETYERIHSGALLLFNSSLILEVKEVKSYTSFSQMLENEGLENVLPGVNNVSEGVEVYRRFYNKEDEEKGVLGIHVMPPSHSTPIKHMTAMLNEVKSEGIMFILGMRFTKGTLIPSLPPPTSSLLLAFQTKHQECRLTVGARALAKHVQRSSCGWWGEFSGSEAKKNKFGLDVICGVIKKGKWMNVHYVTESLHVFEIRVEEGYGARWSADGSKFRGFLEPAMEDGHAKKWRH